MDPRLIQEASEREAAAKPAFVLLAIALACVAGAVGCHLTAEDLSLHGIDAENYAAGRLWCAVAAAAFCCAFAALVAYGRRTPSGRSRGKGRHGSHGSGQSGRRRRRRSRRREASVGRAH